MKPLVLISSQDPEFFLVFSHILKADGFASELASDPAEILRMAAERAPRAVVLDCQPGEDNGAAVCMVLKQDSRTGKIPVVALIASGAESKHLDLLTAGIDEIFVRPFAPQKLLGYLHSLTRPVRADEPSGDGRQFSYGGIELSQETLRVHFEGNEIHLPPIEFNLLCHMLKNPGKIYSREDLIEAAWPRGVSADPRSVDVHIGRLRKAFKPVVEKNVIRTVRSAGYSLNQMEDWKPPGQIE